MSPSIFSTGARRHLRRLYSLVVALLAISICIPAGTARAHASLIGSEPAYASTLTSAPGEVRLLFDNLVEPGLVKVRLKDTDGGEVGKAELIGERIPRADVSFSLPEHGNGQWVIYWTSFAFDGHVVSGTVPYTVDPTATPSTGGAEPGAGTTGGSTNRIIDIVDIQLRFFSYLALGAIFGASLWIYLLRDRRDGAGEVLHTFSTTIIPGACLAGSALALFRGGTAAWRLIDGGYVPGELVELLWNGQLGIYLVAAGGLALAGLLLTGSGRIALVGVSAALLTSVGHAASAPVPGVNAITMSIHLLVACGWVGTVALLAYAATDPTFHGDGDRWATLRQPLTRLSTWLFGGAAILAVTGVRAALVYTDEPLAGRWGTTLLAKLALVLGAGCIGLYHYFRTRKGEGLRSSTLIVESALLVLTLTAAAVLSVTSFYS